MSEVSSMEQLKRRLKVAEIRLATIQAILKDPNTCTADLPDLFADMVRANQSICRLRKQLVDESIQVT